MVTQILKVNGMHCASCASIITKKLSALPSVESVSVNYGNEKAKIAYDENRVTLASLNEEVSKLGYSLSEELHHQRLVVKLIGQGQLHRTAEPCKVTSPGALFPRLTNIPKPFRP